MILCCLFAINNWIACSDLRCCCQEKDREDDVSDQMLVLEYVIRDKHYIGDLQIFYRNRIVTFFSAMIDKLFQFRSLLQIYIYISRLWRLLSSLLASWKKELTWSSAMGLHMRICFPFSNKCCKYYPLKWQWLNTIDLLI